MKISMLGATLLAALTLAACDKQPVVVVPPAPVVVPGPAGPAGPAGATGNQGATGNTGDAGKPGEGTTVVVLPPAASAATN